MSIEEQLLDFTGQSVVFYVKTSQGSPTWLAEGIVLEEPSFRRQGDRLFVVGITTHEVDKAGESGWSDNREACLAWDSVLYYIALPSEDYYAYRNREDATDETSEKRTSIKRQVIGALITALFILILPAILVVLIIWIVKWI